MILILLITYSPQLPTPSDCVRTPSVGRPPPLQGWDFACSPLVTLSGAAADADEMHFTFP
jgi:hypothetical protein